MEPRSLAPFPAPQPSPITMSLAERLLPHAHELGTELADAIRAKADPYVTSGQVSAEELERSCQDNLLRSLQTLAGRVPPGIDLMDAAQVTARRRAETGFPLENLLQAYRLGAEFIWASLLREARTHMPHMLDELLDSAVQVMQLIDLMSVAVAHEYRTRELQAKGRHTERRQAVLDGLLEGRASDASFAKEAMDALGISERTRMAVVVIRHLSASTRPPDSPIEALAADGFESEWRLRADHEVGLVMLGDAPLERLVTRLRASVNGWVGVSDEVVGLDHVGAEFRIAEIVLSTLDDEPPQVVTVADRLPETLLRSHQAIAERIRDRAFGDLLNLPAEKRDPLLDTLEGWFRNSRSTSDTAAEMHCHRNTIVYRLNRVEKLSGSRLDSPRDQLLLRLALMVKDRGF